MDITIFNNDLFGEVRTVIINEEPYFVGKDVATALGYKDINRAVKQHTDTDERKELKRSDCKVYGDLPLALWNNENDFSNKVLINESGLYSLIFGSELPEAKQFKKWVTSEVLPQLRKSGVVILDNATDESIDFARLFGNRRIRKTFRESDNFRELYEQYKVLSKIERDAKRITNKDRINACSIIIDELQNKVANEILTMRPSEMLSIQELITDIQGDIIKLTSKKAGGEKANLTRINNLLLEENKELKQQVEELTPPEKLWTTVNIHGFSCNYSYQYTNKGVHITPAYSNWINTFPNDEIPSREEYEMYQGIDFSKPIGLEIQYVMMDKFDPRNFDKPFIDQLFLRCFGIDDAIVRKTDSYQIGSCNRYEDGKIIFAIYNL